MAGANNLSVLCLALWSMTSHSLLFCTHMRPRLNPGRITAHIINSYYRSGFSSYMGLILNTGNKEIPYYFLCIETKFWVENMQNCKGNLFYTNSFSNP